MRLTYTRPHLLPALHDELVVAGIRPTYLGDTPGVPDGIEMDVPDGTSEPTVAAVVAAHDKAAVEAARATVVQGVLTDAANVKAFMAAPNANITHLQLVAIVKAVVRVVARRFAELVDN